MVYVCSDNYGNDFESHATLFYDKDKAKEWVRQRRAHYHQKDCVDHTMPERCLCTMQPNSGEKCWYHDPAYNPPYDGHTVKDCAHVKPCVFYEHTDIT